MNTRLFLYYYDAKKEMTRLPELLPLLSRDEHARASAFAFEHLTQAYLLRHALLRLVLARHLQTAPSGISFLENAQGKPFIANHPVHFNLSSSHEHIFIGVHMTHAVGVDIETMKPLNDMHGMLREIASDAEYAHFQRLHTSQQLTAFYELWSGKEAILKALGTGFHTDPKSITLSFGPSTPTRVIHLQNDTPAEWRLHRFQLQPHVIAATCIRNSEAVPYWVQQPSI